MAAGILNSPRDCSTPTMEKATPLKNMVGNSIVSSREQSSAVSWSKPLAIRLVRGMENTMPRALRTSVSSPIRVKKLRDRRNASSLPSFSSVSLKIGIKLEEIAEANTASKKFRGIWLAVWKALLAMPVANLCPISISRTSPITFPRKVITMTTPTVLIRFSFFSGSCMEFPSLRAPPDCIIKKWIEQMQLGFQYNIGRSGISAKSP